MRTIFARKILRLDAAKIGAGNVIRKKFMTFPINDIDITGMSVPSEKKWKRYEDYYSLTKLLPHGIVVDENGKIRVG